jgi:hypothetical protein
MNGWWHYCVNMIMGVCYLSQDWFAIKAGSDSFLLSCCSPVLPWCHLSTMLWRSINSLLNFPDSRTRSQINYCSLKLSSLKYSVIAAEKGPRFHIRDTLGSLMLISALSGLVLLLVQQYLDQEDTVGTTTECSIHGAGGILPSLWD